jgi:hypothetical protein
LSYLGLILVYDGDNAEGKRLGSKRGRQADRDQDRPRGRDFLLQCSYGSASRALPNLLRLPTRRAILRVWAWVDSSDHQEERTERSRVGQALIDKQKEPNDRVSFIHWGDKTSASWRYRAKIPSAMDGQAFNDLTADTLIFAKPQANELMDMARAKARGAWVIVDFCDDHFDWVHYKRHYGLLML